MLQLKVLKFSSLVSCLCIINNPNWLTARFVDEEPRIGFYAGKFAIINYYT